MQNGVIIVLTVSCEKENGNTVSCMLSEVERKSLKWQDLLYMWRPADFYFYFFHPNNRAWDSVPERISEMLLSCRDLIRRQHQCCIALPLLSASTDVQEVHTRVIILSLCVFSMSVCYFVLKHASALLHSLALCSWAPARTRENKRWWRSEIIQEQLRLFVWWW